MFGKPDILKFCFYIFDKDKNGVVSYNEFFVAVEGAMLPTFEMHKVEAKKVSEKGATWLDVWILTSWTVWNFTFVNPRLPIGRRCQAGRCRGCRCSRGREGVSFST